MKGKIYSFLFFILLAATALFVFFNPTKVDVHISPNNFYNLPVGLVILGSLIIGFLLMFFISLIKELSSSLKNRKLKNTLEDKEKALQLFEKGLKDYFYGNLKGSLKSIRASVKHDKVAPSIIFLNQIEQDDSEKESLINSLPFDISKFYLMKFYFQSQQWSSVINLSEEFIQDTNFKNRELFELIRDSYRKLEKYDKALMIQEKIMDTKNIDKVANEQILLELKYLDAKSNYSESKINSLIKQYPQSLPFYFLKIQNIDTIGDKTTLINTLKDDFKTSKNPIFLCEIAKLALNSDDDKVVKEAERTLSKLNLPESKLLEALILLKTNNFDKALEISKQFSEGSGDLSKFANLISAESMYRKNMEINENIEIFRKVLNIKDGVNLVCVCNSCGYTASKYSDYCPQCKSFSSMTYSFKIGF